MRKDSCNKKLMQVIYKQLSTDNHYTCHMPDFSEFNGPLYNGDIEESTGIPSNIDNFVQDLKQSSGLIIASPEYNYSTPGTLKNLIDWVSRVKPMPFARKPVLLVSASPALAGGARGLLATEVTLLACGACVFPRTFSLSNAYEAFDEAGRLNDEKLSDDLNKCLAAFLKTLT
jgi:NAD(P)H-dependent FMN reductase